METTIIYPELKETTNAQIEYKCSHSGGYYLTTDLLLSGRGIKIIGDGTDHKRGKKTYQATERAFELLKQKYICCYIALL
jgi:hypothetical protein